MIRFGLSLMPEPHFATAAVPLFEDGTVDAVEWSFDMGWGPSGVPGWLDELADFYGSDGWLLGHGVSFSLMGASGRHDKWLHRLEHETNQRNYRWITEHIGFLGAGRFSFSAPMPMPVDGAIIDLAQQRLQRMAAAAQCPVGVENLATCLSVSDAADQGRLITSLLDSVDGILLLDLHNLWCQSINTGVPVASLLAELPLHRVREIHVAGGTAQEGVVSGRTIRRDTHDRTVPVEVVELLRSTAPRCPNLEAVVYERLGSSLLDPETHPPYRDDVRGIAAEVAQLAGSPGALHPHRQSVTEVAPAAALAAYQAGLLDALDECVDAHELQRRLQPGDGYRFDPDLVAIGAELMTTWGRVSSP